MSDQDFSRLGARLLAENLEEPRARGIDREQGIAIVARAIAERTRRKQRARVLAYGAAFSAAAAVAVVAGFLGARQATSSVDANSACVAAGTCGATPSAIEVIRGLVVPKGVGSSVSSMLMPPMPAVSSSSTVRLTFSALP